MKVACPLTKSFKTKIESSIQSSVIIEAYEKQFKVNVAYLFKGVDTVYVYKCTDTGFRFFYPFVIAGDGKFYESLQQFDWYYMDWKWEHEQASEYIKPGMKILEIGCAQGAFIERASNGNNVECVGLELNANAVMQSQKKGLKIFNQSIQEHSALNPEKYDMVCSFQVMEHVLDVFDVIKASVGALKKGGKLIISVPNNDSFIKLDKNYLNMPPHHMGLWNEQSLLSLTKLFNLKKVNIHLEPPQEYHRDYFIRTVRNHYVNKNNLLSPFFLRYGQNLIQVLMNFFSKRFKAFTIQAVFEKI